MIDIGTFQFNNRQFDLTVDNGDLILDSDTPLRCATIINQSQNTIDNMPNIGYGIDDLIGSNGENVDVNDLMEEFLKDNLDLKNIEYDFKANTIINIEINEL